MPIAVIFDVDGTLIDSVDLHAKAWQDAFLEFGRSLSFDDVRAQIGKGGDQLLPVFLSKEEIDAFGSDLEALRGEILKDRYLPEIKSFPMVRELIRHLRDQGHPIALASSAKEDELQVYERLASIEDLIETETSSDDAEKSKPYPDIFRAALSRLDSVHPEDAVVVGDTPYDAEAAGKAGIRTIGLLCGGWSEAQLQNAGCIAVYEDPADLLRQYPSSVLAPGKPQSKDPALSTSQSRSEEEQTQ